MLKKFQQIFNDLNLDFTPLKLNLIEFVGTLEIPNTDYKLEHTFNLAILYVLTGNSKQQV